MALSARAGVEAVTAAAFAALLAPLAFGQTRALPVVETGPLAPAPALVGVEDGVRPQLDMDELRSDPVLNLETLSLEPSVAARGVQLAQRRALARTSAVLSRRSRGLGRSRGLDLAVRFDGVRRRRGYAVEFDETPALERPLAAAPEPAEFPRRYEIWTKRLSDSANLFFLPLSVPQIVKNFINIHDGALDALASIPWTGQLSGVLGNLLLFGLAISIKSGSWARVQAVGFLTGAIVLAQLTYAGHMPVAALTAVLLGAAAWATAAVTDWAPWRRVVKAAGWAATLLFMYAPVGFLLSIVLHPELAAGFAWSGFVLAMAGNLAMLPEALRVRNTTWLVGSLWGAGVGGVALLAALFALGQVPLWVLAAVALAVPAYLGFVVRLTRRYRKAS